MSKYLIAEPMIEAHQPGWTVPLDNDDDGMAMLWAPREEPPTGGRARTGWAAHWYTDRGYNCDHRKDAPTAAAALTVLDTCPSPRAKQAREALLRAAGGETRGGPRGTRRRDHEPRPDTTTICPNPEACARLLHPELAPGDSCECCGAVIEGGQGDAE